MKKDLALLVLALTGVVGSYRASAQDADCNTNLSLFANDAKVKNYESAYGPWKKVFDNCPQDLHAAIYLYGDDILEYKIENDAANKQQYIDMLLEMYDRYAKNYTTGKYAFSYAEATIEKVRLKEKHGLISNQEIYDQLKDAFDKDEPNFNSEIALYMYFTKTVDIYEDGKVELQTVFDTYDDVAGKIEALRNGVSESMNPLIEQEEAGTLDAKGTKYLARYRKRMDNYEGILESMDGYYSKYATCENLIPLYQKNFEDKKTDEEWLNRAAGKMDEKDCTSDPLYAQIVEQLHSIHPSAKSAYFLGVLAYKKGDIGGAKKWFKEAVDLEQDKYKKADYLLKIASLSKGQEAATYASQALKHNPSANKAYKIIAAAYADSANSCGTTTFTKKAVYWLAAETARKGGFTKDASTYEQYAPSKADIFTENMQGKTIKVGCWINRSIKVPTL